MVARDRVEEATARMLELFPEGFAEESAGDAVDLVAYTDEDGVRRMRENFGEVETVPVTEWEDEWKRFHVPVVVGSLWVGPPWASPAEGLTPVVIDPGRAFGTGGHPTTQLCLELLHDLERGSVLDIGCGSGVLAIAAAKLGFGPVTAIDSDGAAVDATRRNAAANSAELDVHQLDALADVPPSADIVLANLDLATLGALARHLKCPRAVTSGYYENESPALAGFRQLERRCREHWAADFFARE
jgi:ribosomal protein L11 methyltransferase